MSLFDVFKKKVVPVATPKPNTVKKTAKEIATENGDPYVSVLSVELDIDNVGNGAFELDWNDTFLAKLMKAGYKGKTDADIVDLWFKDICRNVLLETYEQEMADPDKRPATRTESNNS